MRTRKLFCFATLMIAVLTSLSSCHNTASPKDILKSIAQWKSEKAKNKVTMNIVIQVQLEDLVQALAGPNSKSPEFAHALALAQELSVIDQRDFITIFAEAWKETSKGAPLAQVFGTLDLKEKINPESTDDQVISVIQAEAETAITNTIHVLRNRIARFGIIRPKIQKLENELFLITLPRVKEPERVRKLLQSTGSLEFWETYDYGEIEGYLYEANSRLAELLPHTKEDVVADASTEAEWKKNNPLLSKLTLSGARGIARIGYADYADTAAINKYLNMPQIKSLFPREFKAMWTVKPSEIVGDGNTFELVAIKTTSRDGKATLDGDAVNDARVQYGNIGATPEVSMTMTSEGANVWAKMTKDNIGKQIAIVLDGMVYSYPTVQSEIVGGRSQITGNFTLEEAEDLANILKSGKLPAPVTIMQEQIQ